MTPKTEAASTCLDEETAKNDGESNTINSQIADNMSQSSLSCKAANGKDYENKAQIPEIRVVKKEELLHLDGFHDRDMTNLVIKLFGHRIAVVPEERDDPIAVMNPYTARWEFGQSHQARNFVERTTDLIEAEAEKWKAPVGPGTDEKVRKRIEDDHQDAKDKLINFATGYRDKAKRAAPVSILCDRSHLRHPASEWDALRDWIAVDRWKVNLRTLEVKPLVPADRVTLTLGSAMPRDLDANVEDTLIVSTIRQIFEGREDQIPYFRRTLFYLLDPVKLCKLWFYFWGGHDRGKTVLIIIIAALLGKLAARMKSEEIQRQEGVERRFSMARLEKALVAYVDETEIGRKFSAQAIKEISGGAPIEAERKFRDPFQFLPQFALVVGSNYQPAFFVDDPAVWERLRLFHLLREFKRTERKIEFKQEGFWVPHLPDLLTWVLQGADDYWREGSMFAVPPSMQASVDEIQHDNDWLGLAINQLFVSGDETPMREVFQLITRWRRNHGKGDKFGYDTLKAQLRERGYRIKKGEIVLGLVVNPESPEYTEGV
jgi:phage/plasmid-associated DNA primase